MTRSLLLLLTCVAFAQTGIQSTTPSITVEAESFLRQERTEVRRWEIQKGLGASGGAYLQAVPDTRRTHDDKLIKGENFSDEPGQLAVLTYQAAFPAPGRYYVSVRAYSTGTEDNGIHVGLNGQWPESGRRMQWCEGKNEWTWASKQRTAANHCGEHGKIWLDVPTAGVHTVHFSLREDGFRFDQFRLTTAPPPAPAQSSKP